MKARRVGFLTIAAIAAYAPIAAAQACVGFPTLDRQFSFGGSLGFPDGGKHYGVEVSYNLPGPGSVYGGMNIFSPDGDGDSQDSFFGGAAFDLASVPLGAGGTVLQVCPTAELGYSSFEGGSVVSLPLGVGVGTNVALTPTAQLMPYVVPQFAMTRVSIDDYGSNSEWDFGVRAGAVVGAGLFYVGGELQRVFADNADTVFRIRAGIRL